MATLNTVTSSTRPASPTAGEAYFETDTNKIIVWNGTSWTEIVSDGTLSSFSNAYSLELDGTNDYVEVGSVTGFSLKGLSLWIKPDHVITYNSAGIDYVIGLGDGDEGLFLSGDLSSRLNDEVIGFAGAAGNYLWGYSGQGISISADWHHIAVTWNVSNSSTNPGNEGYDIYLDGVSVGNEYGTWGSGNGVPFTCDFVRIGARNRGGSATYYTGGYIDEVAVFDTSLSASDITTMYNSGVPTDITSLSPVGWWRMGDNDSGTGTTITDQGSGSNDGTLTNSPTFSSSVPS